MANGYTAVPAIIPGNLTVNGTLTINSDCGIILGAANPRVRLFKNVTGGASVSTNLGCDGNTRDSAGVAAYELEMNPGNNRAFLKFLNSAGGVQNEELDRTAAQDGAVVGNTGNTTENTVKSKNIVANRFGPDGVLLVKALFDGISQGATQTVFRLKFGATTLLSFGRTTATQFLMHAVVWAKASNNSQETFGYLVDGGSAVQATSSTTAADMTVDESLIITIQNGAVTDNWNIVGWKVCSFVGAQQAI